MPKKADNIVKESNAIARALIRPSTTSVWEERLIATLAARNRTDDLEFQTHTLDVRELAATKTLSTRQYQEAKRAVKEMGHKTYEIPMGKRGVKVLPIFAELSIDDDGVIVGHFNPRLKEHYLELKKQFAMRSLPEFQALTSTYSQQLFRFLNSWKSVSEKTVDIDELHKLLSTPSSFQKNFNTFCRRVLQVAHREINASTSLSYDWVPIREGKRKVVAVQFIFDVGAARKKAKIAELKAAAKEQATKTQSKENQEFDKIQSESNKCFEGLYINSSKGCTPKQRSKKCKYCTTRGRMYAREAAKAV